MLLWAKTHYSGLKLFIKYLRLINIGQVRFRKVTERTVGHTAASGQWRGRS